MWAITMALGVKAIRKAVLRGMSIPPYPSFHASSSSSPFPNHVRQVTNPFSSWFIFFICTNEHIHECFYISFLYKGQPTTDALLHFVSFWPPWPRGGSYSLWSLSLGSSSLFLVPWNAPIWFRKSPELSELGFIFCQDLKWFIFLSTNCSLPRSSVPQPQWPCLGLMVLSIDKSGTEPEGLVSYTGEL